MNRQPYQLTRRSLLAAAATSWAGWTAWPAWGGEQRVEIERIDYLRDTARIYVYYFEQEWRDSGGGYQPGDNDD